MIVSYLESAFEMYLEDIEVCILVEGIRKADRLEASHGEEVGHHGGEARRETTLRDEAQL
jgi:hypothetical protein